MSSAVVWFRRDLRLDDNPALAAAVRAHDRVLCTYIHAPDEEAPWAPGAASRWWLHHSLAALDADLRRRGARLHIARGPTSSTLECLLRETSADAVYWNRLYEPAAEARDAQVSARLHELGAAAHTFNASLLFEPWEIRNAQGGAYRVFTPFWRSARARIEPVPPIAAPHRLHEHQHADGLELDALRLLPQSGWDAQFHEHWRPGAVAALKRARRFCSKSLADYPQLRDRPHANATSQLSAHLHFGEIGPRQLAWLMAEQALEQPSSSFQAGTEAFLRELGWREFSHHLLHHSPQSAQCNLDARFDRFAWAAPDPELLAHWQRGTTGIPIVDAGMRQLWKCGWMHNRVRMLAASFLTKNLRTHWLAGARWFWDTLIDADLANNTQGWQWTAGSGADAAPYFRVFNPVRQAQQFDPDGRYIQRWVAELKHAPPHLVHEPWLDPAFLRRSGYPPPIADLKRSRELALEAYGAMRAVP